MFSSCYSELFFYPFPLFHLLCMALELSFAIGSKKPFPGRTILLAENWVVESRMEKFACD